MAVIILGEEVHLRENISGALRRHWLLWGLLIATVALDYFSTLYFMARDGVDTEANVIIRWLVYQLGVNAGVLVGKAMQLVAALIFVGLTERLARGVLLLLVLLNSLAIIVNLT